MKTSSALGHLYDDYDAFKKGLFHRDPSEPDFYDDTLYELVDSMLVSRGRLSVCDLGCGDGRKLATLDAIDGVQVTGCDIGAYEGPMELEVENADISSFLESTDAEWDLIILNDVLEHFELDDALPLLSSIRARLRADGSLYIHVPNAASPMGWVYQAGDLTHCSQWSESALRQVASVTGYEVRKICEDRLASRRFSPWWKRAAASAAYRVGNLALSGFAWLLFRRLIVMSPNVVAIYGRRRPE